MGREVAFSSKELYPDNSCSGCVRGWWDCCTHHKYVGRHLRIAGMGNWRWACGWFWHLQVPGEGGSLKFILPILFEIWPFVYKTISGFSESAILRNLILKFPVPVVLDMTGCRKCKFFMGNWLKMCQKSHRGDKKKTKQNKKRITV